MTVTRIAKTISIALPIHVLAILSMVEHAYLARYRQHSRIDLSVYRSTSEEKHGRLLKRGSGVSVTYDF